MRLKYPIIAEDEVPDMRSPTVLSEKYPSTPTSAPASTPTTLFWERDHWEKVKPSQRQGYGLAVKTISHSGICAYSKTPDNNIQKIKTNNQVTSRIACWPTDINIAKHRLAPERDLCSTSEGKTVCLSRHPEHNCHLTTPKALPLPHTHQQPCWPETLFSWTAYLQSQII